MGRFLKNAGKFILSTAVVTGAAAIAYKAYEKYLKKPEEEKEPDAESSVSETSEASEEAETPAEDSTDRKYVNIVLDWDSESKPDDEAAGESVSGDPAPEEEQDAPGESPDSSIHLEEE